MHTNSQFIGGRWVASAGTTTIDVIDPTHETVLDRIPAGDPADVDRAVAAASAALAGWSAVPLAERVALCERVTALLELRQDELAELVTREMGMPLGLSKRVQIGNPLNTFRSMTQVAAEVDWERRVGNSIVVREPVGVVGAITPWNFPLHQIAAKVAPALIAGCTVVLKPSEVAPLNAFVFMEILADAGLPDGVVNLVTGPGPTVGEALCIHPGVDMVSFTGSTRAGARVAQLATGRIARIALELGGKSPNVLLPGAPFDKAVKAGLNAAYLNAGQTCSALTRMIVPRERLAEVEERAAAAAETFVAGDPFDKATRLGPLVSQAQWDRVQGFIASGIEQGARVLTGGTGRPDGIDTGYFVRPTVFTDVRRDMAIAREEIFGPVLSIFAYDSVDEAVEIANDTEYGLAAGVWGESVDDALPVARRIRAGQVDVNGGAFNPVAPFGGYGRSGIGREYGTYGVEEFCEVKSLQV